MTRNLNVRNAVKLALTVNAGLVGLSAAPGALAQEGAGELEEITVTGSRIKKKDFVSNAPVATVGLEQIELTGTVNAESLLNTLPQAIPGLDRTSNNPGNGTSTVDLRGLGSNRTLVLINGQRVVPNNSSGVVDINSIPTSLIQNIEVLTGGASAVYGSDAVAGVVNFILKDDFEGIAMNAGYEVTEEGDGAITTIDITLGANVADGRGNVAFNMAYTDRDDLFQGDRDFSFFALFDDGMGGLEPGGSSFVPGTSIFNSGALGGFSPTGAVIFNQDGTVRPFNTSGADQDYYNYQPVNYIQLPQQRYQATALGHFDLTDRVTGYGRAMYTSSTVPQQLAPTPIFAPSQFTLDGNPFLSAQAQGVMQVFGDGVDTDGDGIDDTATASLRRRMRETGPRISDDQFSSFQMMAGVRGDISESWQFDAYIQSGSVDRTNTTLGDLSTTRFDQALLLDLSDPTGATCTDPSANGGAGPCVGMNIFGEGNVSQATADFLVTAISSTANYKQDVYAVTFTGEIGGFELPGGAVGAAFGYEHIDDNFDFRPSQDLAAGTLAGFNGIPAVSGGFTSSSFYGELYLPILSGAPMADLLDMELAYRSSDYSTAGTVEAYKISASWAPIDQFRIRGGYNRAVRAPNIGELFQPAGEGFPSAQDPCSANGANPFDPAVVAICAATGVPAASQGTATINTISGQVRQLAGGNPNLIEETADTYTVGVVVTPAALEGLTFSIDYFDIEIDDYITRFGGGASTVLNTCYDPADPSGGIGSLFCSVITRLPGDGFIDFVEVSNQNAATQTLKGFDLLASYDMDLWGGDFRVNYVGTFTDESDFTPFEGASVDECAGTFGSICGEPLPEYKHRMTFRWAGENITGQLLWRVVGEVDDDDDLNTFSVESIDAQHYFDASGTYRFTDNYAVTFGIDNLLDEDPPVVGDGNNEQANTWPASYDVFGRTYFLRASAEF